MQRCGKVICLCTLCIAQTDGNSDNRSSLAYNCMHFCVRCTVSFFLNPFLCVKAGTFYFFMIVVCFLSNPAGYKPKLECSQILKILSIVFLVYSKRSSKCKKLLDYKLGLSRTLLHGSCFSVIEHKRLTQIFL